MKIEDQETSDDRKLNAALNVVADSLLHGWTIESRIKYISSVLPDHYTVQESKQKGNVHAYSRTGMDDEAWGYLMEMLQNRFPDFLEVFHNTCTNHVNVTIYFRQKPQP